MHTKRLSIVGIAALGILLLTSVAPAFAHEKRDVTVNGTVWHMRVGSQIEPPYTDYQNAAQMFMTRTVLVNGVNQTVAVTGLQNYLKVNITTGGHTITLPLKTVSTDPTQYIAPFIPTVAGTYIYTYFGNINGTYFDQAFSCANGQFECVADPSAVEFPVPTPTQYQLANEVKSINATVGTLSAAPTPDAPSSSPNDIAYAAVGVAVISLLIAVLALSRKGVKS